MQFKSLGLVRLYNVFERSLLFSPRLHFFKQKYSKKKTVDTEIVLQLYTSFLIEYILNWNAFMRCKAEFSASLLQFQCHMILQKSF